MSIIKAQWVILPTDKKLTTIGRYKDSDTLVFNDFVSDIVRGEPYEVYITVDEPTRFGDWGMGYAIGFRGRGAGNYLWKHINDSKSILTAICEGNRKVVASTDKDLSDNVPLIDIEFLKSLVFRYNWNGTGQVYGDVLIEYEECQEYFKKSKIVKLFNEITDGKPTFTAYGVDGNLLAENEPYSSLYTLPKLTEAGTVVGKFIKEL